MILSLHSHKDARLGVLAAMQGKDQSSHRPAVMMAME